MIDLPTLVLIFATLAAGAMAKGITGMGLPLIALPVLTTALGLQHAVGLMVIPIILSNAWQVWTSRKAWRAPELRFLTLFLAGGAAGVVAGTWLLTSLPERLLAASLGVMLIGYVFLRLVRPGLKIGEAAAAATGLPVGAAAGVLHGATGISSPIGVTFIHAMALDREMHVFAVSAMFLVFALVQLPALILAGVMQTSWLIEGLFAMVPILLFMPLGTVIAGKLSRAAFDRVMLVFLGAIGLKVANGTLGRRA